MPRCAGWTALSNTGPGEGTLRVFPDVSLATAYLVLRPFFRPRRGREGRLGFDDWEVDVRTTDFPGSVKGKGACPTCSEANSRWRALVAIAPAAVTACRDTYARLLAGQELSDKTHPHLRLSQTMTSVPRVKPGSQVYWHCDGASTSPSPSRRRADLGPRPAGALTPLLPARASTLHSDPLG